MAAGDTSQTKLLGWFLQQQTVAMCKMLLVVITFFECVQINSAFLGSDSLPFILIITYNLLYRLCNYTIYDCRQYMHACQSGGLDLKSVVYMQERMLHW